MVQSTRLVCRISEWVGLSVLMDVVHSKWRAQDVLAMMMVSGAAWLSPPQDKAYYLVFKCGEVNFS